MIDGMRQTVAKREYPYQLVVRDAETSLIQLSQVEDFIESGVDAIVLAPVDSEDVDPAILEANTADIPVFTVDIEDETGEERVAASITSNNEGGGESAGHALCQLPKDRTILILGQPGITSVRERVFGFRKIISQCRHSFPKGLNGGTSSDSAAKALKTVLGEQRHLGAVFAVNDTMALGALQAIGDAKCHHTVSGHIDVIGYDGSPDAIADVGKGDISLEVVQYPQKLGSLAIKQIHDYFLKTLHQTTPVPTTTYRKGEPTPTPWSSATPNAPRATGSRCS